eukprot:gene33777-46766_t
MLQARAMCETRRRREANAAEPREAARCRGVPRCSAGFRCASRPGAPAGCAGR